MLLLAAAAAVLEVARAAVRAPPLARSAVNVATIVNAQCSCFTSDTLCTPTARRTTPEPAFGDARGKARGSGTPPRLALVSTLPPPTDACGGRDAAQSGIVSVCTAASAWKASNAQNALAPCPRRSSRSTTGYWPTEAISTGSPPSRVRRSVNIGCGSFGGAVGTSRWKYLMRRLVG